MANDPKSLKGMEYHTPSRSQNRGRMYASGNNMNNCLESDRKMDIFTFPMHWKKLVMTA